MALRFVEKITAALCAAVLLAAPIRAEEFVKYSEAQNQLQSRVPEKGSISAGELQSLLAQGAAPVIFDARAKREFERERIAGARLPKPDAYYRDMELFRQQIVRTAPNSRVALDSQTRGLARETVIVTYCNKHCGLSKNLKLDLEALGFTSVRWLDGGIDVWREKGYPVEKG